MTTLEHSQSRVSSPVVSLQDKLHSAEGTGTPKPEDLQQRLSAVLSSTPSKHTRSNHLSEEGKKCVLSDGADSGYASIASSPDSKKEQFLARDLPGTRLKYFSTPISEQLRDRFFDIKILYTQPLFDAISKKRSNPGDVSMKLKYLGSSEDTARPYIIIQCAKKVSKKVTKFFAQDHVKEVLKDDFCVFVLDQELRRLVADNAINVLANYWPKETLCGLPIKIARDGISSTATLGGLIMVETAETHLYGLTAGHCLKRDGDSYPKTSEMNEDLDSDSGSDCSDVDSELENFDWIGSLLYSSSENSEAGDVESVAETKVIGNITYHSFSGPTERNYDWALIDLKPLHLEPNALVLNDLGPPGSRLGPEGLGKTIVWISSSGRAGSTPKKVLVLTNHGPQSGVLMFNGSCLLMDPGSKFVHTYDLTMCADSSLSPGDSGSWVVGEGTGSVYGHVVSIDAFGEGQVMPISLTLESIRVQLDAVRVWLPTRADVRTAMAAPRSQNNPAAPRPAVTRSQNSSAVPRSRNKPADPQYSNNAMDRAATARTSPWFINRNRD